MQKQIIKQGGSLVVTLSPDVLAANGYALGDIVDVTIKHTEDFEKQSDKIFARMAGQRMKAMGVNKISITLTDTEENKEKPQDEKIKTKT